MKPRPCERRCRECGIWKHHSRFHAKGLKKAGNNTDAHHIRFSPICRDCEQIERNKKKNLDRPKAIIENRARVAATKAGASFEFFWTEMNYRALVPVMRAMLSDEGLCLACGHKFENERAVQIEHHFPPRFQKDWALLHTRNLGFSCGSCNRTKGKKPPLEWLDEQELARLANKRAANPESMPSPAEDWQQASLFDLGFK
jgi:hypothetical protein